MGLFGEVPVTPLVAPAAVLAFGVLLWRLHRRGDLSLLRALVAAGLCVYGAGVVANTVFPIYLDMPGGTPPWSMSISTRLFVGYELGDAVQNIVVFVPLGVFAFLVAGTRSLWRVAGLGVLFSLLIETVQFFSHHWANGGHVADINDLFFNALGAPVGYGLVVLAARVPVLAGLVDRMTWPSSDDANPPATNDGRPSARTGS